MNNEQNNLNQNYFNTQGNNGMNNNQSFQNNLNQNNFSVQGNNGMNNNQSFQNNLNQNNFSVQGNNGMNNNQSFQNNLSQNNFNTQDNNGMINNQSLHSNQGINIGQSSINEQPQQLQNFEQPINQMNFQHSAQDTMSTFNDGNSNNQNFSSKSPKKKNLGLIIGAVIGVAVAIVIAILVLSNKEGSSFGFESNKTKLNGTIFVSGKNGNLLKTTNGTDWETVNLPSTDVVNSSELRVNGIEYVNGEYILYAKKQGKNGGMNYDTVLYKSTDGSTWKLLGFIGLGTLEKLNYINNNYYVIGQWGATATRQLFCGKDLLTSEELFENDDLFKKWNAYVKDYAYGNNKFIVHVEGKKHYYGADDVEFKYFYVSTDGQNFEKHETDISLDQIEFGNNVFIGISAFENYGIFKSDDGINWIKVLDLDDASLYDYGIFYNENEFYVWYNDAIYKSSDGVNWKEFYKSSNDERIKEFDYKNGIFAYVSVYTETDPKTYESVHTYKTHISTDGKKWIESSLNAEDFSSSTINILEK